MTTPTRHADAGGLWPALPLSTPGYAPASVIGGTMPRWKTTMYLEREFEAHAAGKLDYDKFRPLKPRVTEAATKEEAAVLAEQEAEAFHGEPVMLIMTALLED